MNGMRATFSINVRQYQGTVVLFWSSTSSELIANRLIYNNIRCSYRKEYENFPQASFAGAHAVCKPKRGEGEKMDITAS